MRQPKLIPDAPTDGASEPAAAARPGPERRPNTGDLNDLTGTEWVKSTKSWFVCDSRRYRRNRNTEMHPARYPEEMVAQFLRFFTQADAWVLDPFCGSGATLVACLEEGRRGIGVELSEKYAAMAAARIPPEAAERARAVRGDVRGIGEAGFWDQVRVGQASRLSGEDMDRRDGSATPDRRDACPTRDADGLPQFDFVITSPPYWNMLHRSRGGVRSKQKQRAEADLDTRYSNDPLDLGNVVEYDDFIEALGVAFDNCARLLRPGKYLVCVVQNCRTPEGEVRPLAWDLARRISQTLSFQGERIWCQDSKLLGIWGYPKVFVPNYHHHYCLIFRKPAE